MKVLWALLLVVIIFISIVFFIGCARLGSEADRHRQEIIDQELKKNR